VVVLFCGGVGAAAEARADATAGATIRKGIRPGRDESTPEIVVLGIEEVVLDAPNRAAAGSSVRQDAAAVPRPPAATPSSGARAEALPQLKEGERLCRVCKSPFDTEYCPFCGTKGEPVS